MEEPGEAFISKHSSTMITHFLSFHIVRNLHSVPVTCVGQFNTVGLGFNSYIFLSFPHESCRKITPVINSKEKRDNKLVNFTELTYARSD